MGDDDPSVVPEADRRNEVATAVDLGDLDVTFGSGGCWNWRWLRGFGRHWLGMAATHRCCRLRNLQVPSFA